MAKKASQEIGRVLLQGCRCRCGHEWLPRSTTEVPRVCPRCKSANWDRPKMSERKKAEEALAKTSSGILLEEKQEKS
jgi:predicted Zn-ribbon and HTH transcriptional regulator